jgi:hypothetical protein
MTEKATRQVRRETQSRKSNRSSGFVGPSGETGLHFRSCGTKIEEADNMRAVGATVHWTAATELRVSRQKKENGHRKSGFRFLVCGRIF